MEAPCTRNALFAQAERQKHEKLESKRLIPTSFGPEENEIVVMQHEMQLNKKKRLTKEELAVQIEVRLKPQQTLNSLCVVFLCSEPEERAGLAEENQD